MRILSRCEVIGTVMSNPMISVVACRAKIVGSRVSNIESGSALSHLTLDDASSSSPPAPLRFLTLKHATEVVTYEVEGRVTLTTFLVPRKVDDVYGMWSVERQLQQCVWHLLPSRLRVHAIAFHFHV